MTDDIYLRLREFLDTLPAGFPSTPTGVEIKILKKLFAPDEAELTMKLKKDAEDVSVIAERVGTSETELAAKLEQMALKGLIFRVRDGEKKRYQAFQFLVGIYEFQLNNIDKEFCELFEAYLPYIGISFSQFKTSQMRIIPVESAIDTRSSVATYNKVRDLVKQQEIISVADCICRKEQGLLGHECDKPQETCIGFGDFAQYYIDNKMAKAVTTDEALNLLDHAEASGLVLQPTNTQDIEAICCCCACCCPGLKYAKMSHRPADLVHSYYYSTIDADLCTACGDCIERCPMDAIVEGEASSEIVSERCIGCGLCVAACPERAISLVAKPEMEAPPRDFVEVLNKIESERKQVASSSQ
jgi:formate hydrogenlyase subunit 6/NADH:ubiquinone oxidoreductase subunit I